MKSAPLFVGLFLLALPSCDRARALVERTKDAVPDAALPATPESGKETPAEPQPAVRPMTDDWRPSGLERR
jgi:hypothetical protein